MWDEVGFEIAFGSKKKGGGVHSVWHGMAIYAKGWGPEQEKLRKPCYFLMYLFTLNSLVKWQLLPGEREKDGQTNRQTETKSARKGKRKPASQPDRQLISARKTSHKHNKDPACLQQFSPSMRVNIRYTNLLKTFWYTRCTSWMLVWRLLSVN